MRLEKPIRKHNAFIAGIDPFEGLKKSAPRGLPMRNCDFDFGQPSLYAVMRYSELLPVYAAHPSQLRLRTYPAGHVFTSKMEHDAAAWFCEKLGLS